MKKQHFLLIITFIHPIWACADQNTAGAKILDSIILQILSQKDFQFNKYCLDILGQKPSINLTDKLTSLGQNPSACNTETTVHFSDYSHNEKSYFIKYNYDCGPLCGGGFECFLSVKKNEEPALDKCNQAWES